MLSTRSALRRSAATVTLSAAMLVPVPVPVPVAGLPATSASASTTQAFDPRPLGERAVEEAARHEGKPYRYGATGPDSFDCSGFVQYVYRQLGVELPRTSRDQHRAVQHVDRSGLRLGDLVFLRYDGQISHVGIYSGNGHFWVARRSGTTITNQRIWTNDFLVGRVG